MAQPARRKAPMWMKFLALALLALAVIFAVNAGRVARQYEALAATTPVPSQAPPPLNFTPLAEMYRHGSVGPEVIALQQRLKDLGYYHTELDGKYYGETEAAVKAFQLQHGLDADGIAGAITLGVLNSAQAQPYVVPSASPAPTASQAPTDGSYVPPAP